MLFDVLINIYEDYGYTAREAAVSIVQHNLWGLDIDDRAAQLAYFAVMMKARQYDRRFFSRGVQPHVYAIQESNGINREHLNYLGRGLSVLERNNAITQMNALLDEFIDAKEYGSILQPKEYDWALLSRFVEDTTPMQQMSFGEAGLDATQAQLRAMIAQGQALAQKYHVAVTNPPYMNPGTAKGHLHDYVKTVFPDSKSDLFAVFIEQLYFMLLKNGYQGMITQHAWMFLSSYEKLRRQLITRDCINMAHLGARAFEEIGGEVVQTTSFVIRKSRFAHYKGSYVRLTDPTSQSGKENMFLSGDTHFIVKQEDFDKIPGIPFAYWISEKQYANFERPRISAIADPKSGMTTTDNTRFLRLWHEVSMKRIGFGYRQIDDTVDCKFKWFPFCKGGDFRKWYGNQEYIVNWFNNGKEIRKAAEGATGGRLVNVDVALQECLVWTKISTSSIAFRYKHEGIFFSDAAPGVFSEENKLFYLLGLLNSVYSATTLNIINPTLNYVPGAVSAIPYIEDHFSTVTGIVRQCIGLSRADWDSHETSWDFQRHPLITVRSEIAYGQFAAARMSAANRLKACFEEWKAQCESRFQRLKANEEELNRIFIDIYGLQDELTPEVEDKDVTVRRADLGRDIRSLISYLVGVVMGRYSLDVPGLAYAGGDWDAIKYRTYQPDDDGIVPIYRGIGMDDGLTARIIKLIKQIYGEESYRENMEFIAEALGKKQNESAEETLNRYLNDGFYADHLKVYQKRPIYWLFTSGKNGGFKCLIYMHRYNQDTLARINGRYFLPESTRLKHDLEDIDQRISAAEGSERVRLEKERQRLMACYQEALAYGQVLDHMANKYIAIDLDDGVKVNYAKFQGVEMVTDSGSKVKMDLLAPLK